jgi:hypothetical protein
VGSFLQNCTTSSISEKRAIGKSGPKISSVMIGALANAAKSEPKSKADGSMYLAVGRAVLTAEADRSRKLCRANINQG